MASGGEYGAGDPGWEQSPPTSRMSEHQRNRVLCFDREATSLLVRKFVLEQGGYEVLTAADVETGLRLLQEQRPDLLVLDETLIRPTKPHLELLRQRRSTLVLVIGDMQWPDQSTRELADDFFWRAEPAERLLEKVREMLDGNGRREDA